MPRVFPPYRCAVLSLLYVAQVKGLDFTYSFDCNPSASLDDYGSSPKTDTFTYVNPAETSCVNIFRKSYNVQVVVQGAQWSETGNTYTPEAQLPGALFRHTPPFNVIKDCCNGGCRGCFAPDGGRSCVYRVWKTGGTNIIQKGRCSLCEQVNCNSYCLNGQVNIPNPSPISRRALTSVPILLTDGSPVRHHEPCKPLCHSSFGNI
jgi:hypothetical protein